METPAAPGLTKRQAAAVFTAGLAFSLAVLFRLWHLNGFPRFTHHGLRHFFATACVESGVDIPTVSRWLGHKDGGALAMRVYGHLREAHSDAMVAQVSFATKDAKIVPMPDISGFHQSSGT